MRTGTPGSLVLVGIAWLAFGCAKANPANGALSPQDAGGPNDAGQGTTDPGADCGAGGCRPADVGASIDPSESPRSEPPRSETDGDAPRSPARDPRTALGACEVERMFESSAGCDVGLACERGFVYLACGGGAPDDWRCDCSRAYWDAEYTLTAPADGETCVELALACAAGLPSRDEAPVMCSELADEATPFVPSCSSTLDCRFPIALAGGASAERREQSETRCTFEDGTWSCGCDSQGGVTEVSFAGDEDEPICEMLGDLCAPGAFEPGFETTCAGQLVDGSAGAAFCASRLDCTHSASVAGREAVVSKLRRVRCRRGEADGWSCLCTGAGFALELDTPGDDASEVCLLAGQECARTP